QLAEIDDGQPGGYSWNDILAALGKVVGHPIRSWRMPRGLLIPAAWANACLCRLRHRPDVFGPDKLPELYYPDWVAKPSDLPIIVRWQPGFHLEKGFRNTFDWYRDHSFIT